ncbi:MAG: hypothetical protein MUF00_04770 [Gemmatimonadaceae bacterium]|jgi:hypothetical protein|nr:hypothetical protein [Gemmatimonadaceae bacterium]
MSRIAFSVAAPKASALRALNYSPFAEKFRQHASRKVQRLRDLVDSAGASFGAVFTRVDCEVDAGVELLSQVDVFAAEPACRVIRRDSMPRPDNHLVRRGQILIAAAGQMGESTLFGRCMLADGRLAGKYLGPDVLALTFRDEAKDAKYAYAVLGSRYGLQLIRSAAYGTSIPRVRQDLLLDLPIPDADSATRDRIVMLVERAMQERERFAAELGAARAPVELLPEMQRAHAACAARRVRVGVQSPPFRTLSAWNHVSTGAAHPLLQHAWKARLGDVVPIDGIFNGLRFGRLECAPPYGIELLSQRDVFLLRPVPQRVSHPGFSDRKLFVPADSLLVGGAGTLGEGEIFGRAVYVSEGMSRYAVTEHMLRVQPRPEHAPLAYAFLSTLVGRRLLRSTAVGTKILSMRPDLLRALPFPDVDEATAAIVKQHLLEAMRARDAADRAEAEAIRLVETEVIPEWLN